MAKLTKRINAGDIIIEQYEGDLHKNILDNDISSLILRYMDREKLDGLVIKAERLDDNSIDITKHLIYDKNKSITEQQADILINTLLKNEEEI